MLGSRRLSDTDEPHIENLLTKYAHIPDLLILALGSCYWAPPDEALHKTIRDIGCESSVHKYGNGFGIDSLIESIREYLEAKGVATKPLDIMITPGANQAFANTAMVLCDPTQRAVLIAPYYFSHLMCLQAANVDVIICPFDAATLLPIWSALEDILTSAKPFLVVLTTPNNPSGKVWNIEDIKKLVHMCRSADAWLVIDQTYAEFLYDGARHSIPCSSAVGYDKIIHIFSFSKCFGMPGWRVGYIAYPSVLRGSFSKIQDAFPTHAPIVSQILANHCLHEDKSCYKQNGQSWVASRVSTLIPLRERLWEIVSLLGTVRTHGAIYYLIPVPPLVEENEAVDILATQFGVLLIHGSSFGASGHLRLSYGSISPETMVTACDRLKKGIARLIDLSKERTIMISTELKTHSWA